ncbi:TetR/AcrR family transcriptional regulator [Pseudoroseomonas cervicalis]|uniref:TetR/AcrR family transcriptional regulator n=1 Tax=Teichococcus cervicalis TaxID=204525 RepID=UPI00277FE92F|nr:TetR/AcrR family transcriptional regulator [Pseudoroseomonas cervicalis]MDQ1079666.1 AcrR family transcriptional regulator [Pseudoroseomonas cervicalis]
MQPSPKPRGGRPWSFDREAALETAMRLFWRHGYEGVSIGELTRAIGVAPPSLYAAFGSKAGLYQEALRRYEAELGGFDGEAIAAAPSLAEAARRLLDGAVTAVTRSAELRGCMISSGLVTCHPDHAELAAHAAGRREAMRARIAAALAPFAEGEALQRLSRHLATLLQGLSIQARDGVAEAELRGIVEEAVAGLAARALPGPRSGG